MRCLESIPFQYRKQGRFTMANELEQMDFKAFRALKTEAKNLWWYCVHLHDPRKPLPTPAAYHRISGCPPSSAYDAYSGLRKLGYVLMVYDEGDYHDFVNPSVLWKGTEKSRVIQKAKLEKLLCPVL